MVADLASSDISEGGLTLVKLEAKMRRRDFQERMTGGDIS